MTKISNITNIPDFNIPNTTVKKSEMDISLLVSDFIKTQKQQIQREYKETEQLDIFDFLTLVRKSVESRQDTERVKDENKILFLEDDPNTKEIDTEAVTFLFDYRLPGQFSQGPLGKAKVRELSAHVRAVNEHPDNPGEKILTYGKFRETRIKFYAYARTDKVALQRAFWFTDLMDSYSWVFGLYGFRAIEEGIFKKEEVVLKDLPLVRYPIYYLIRHEDIYHTNEQELREVLLNVNVS